MADKRKETAVFQAAPVADGRLAWSRPRFSRHDAKDAENSINIFTEANTGNS